MKNNITFGKWESVALLVNAICARIFLNVPRPSIEIAGTAGWINMIYISTLAFLGFTIISKLYKKFESKDIIDISEYIGGGILRVVIGVIGVCDILYACCITLREYAENMKIIALATSPISYVMLFFLGSMVIGAYAGIEAIVRLHAIAVPLIAAGLLIIVIGISPFYDISNLFPILGEGPEKIFGRGFFILSTISPLIYLFLLPPYIKTHKNFKEIGYTSLGISTFLLLVSVLAYELVFHYPTGTENFLPTFQMARMINYGRFFQRVESVFMFAWVASSLLYLSAMLFFITDIFRKTFRLKYHKPLIFPFIILIFCISLLPPNLMTAIELDTRYFSYFAWFLTFMMPMILLFIGRMVKRQQKKGRMENE